MLRSLFALAIAAAPCVADASQQWPLSLVGTWESGISNQSQPVTFTITSQSGGTTCQQIKGFMGSDTLLGYYCPGSGRFNFLRTNSAGVTYQVYTGNASAQGGQPFLGGTFADVSDNPTGEYNFYSDLAHN